MYPWTAHPHTFWGSGRHALRAILAWGRTSQGWRRLFCPSFFCQEVVAAFQRELEVVVYEDAPTKPLGQLPNAGVGDVLLVVNTFGGRAAPPTYDGGIVIEDHTHDPLSDWAQASSAHYAVASLRKTLPLPDGAVLWSPRGSAIPSEQVMTIEHAQVVSSRLSAMILKRHYLLGHQVRKEEFRRMAAGAEQEIATEGVSGISPFSSARLPSLPAWKWRKARAANLEAFRGALGDPSGVTVLDAPFAATLVFDEPGQRDRVRDALVAARIYPAILWPLEHPVVAGIPEPHVDLARRIFSIHCDYRYAPGDMIRVAREIRKAIGER